MLSPAHSPSDPGKLRSLASIADADGFFAVVAIDHPAAFVLGHEPADAEAGHRESVVAKVAIARALGAHASAVLVDPETSLVPLLATGTLPGPTGLVVNVELESYQLVADATTVTALRPGWDAAKIRLVGGDGLKLLWRYRHEVPEAAAHRDVVRRLANECAAVSLPLIVEPIWVPLPGEDLTDPTVRATRVRGVVEYARLACELGADVVKTEFPGWVGSEEEERDGALACAELDAAVTVPWLLLSAGVTFAQFLRQTEIASRAGASGFIAGRAVWDAAVSSDPAQRAAGLEEAVRRMDVLRAVVRAHGTPWRPATSVEQVLATFPRDWYTTWHEG